MIDPITTLLGIAQQLILHIFDYYRSLDLVSEILFMNKANQDIAILYNDRSCHDLACDRLLTSLT